MQLTKKIQCVKLTAAMHQAILWAKLLSRLSYNIKELQILRATCITLRRVHGQILPSWKKTKYKIRYFLLAPLIYIHCSAIQTSMITQLRSHSPVNTFCSSGFSWLSTQFFRYQQASARRGGRILWKNNPRYHSHAGFVSKLLRQIAKAWKAESGYR